jgi:2'-5' RNA ligase
MDQIRSFVAIELEDELKQELRQLQRDLSSRGIRDEVRWVKLEGMHLTLKFLGNVPADRIEPIELALAQACEGAQRFRIEFRGLGCFPNLSRPNVIWVGVEGDIDPLSALQHSIEQHLATLGYAPEKRAYTPHLTLGRVARNVDPKQRRRIGELIERTTVDTLGEMATREISLMRSDLSPSGAKYTRLASVPLEEED